MTRNKILNNDLKDLTIRRISKMRRMFREYDIDVTGNPEYPSLLLDKNKLLFTYINNFNLYFLKDFPVTGYQPETVLEYKIKEGTEFDESFDNYIKYYWKKVFVIRHKDTNLYLTGYNLDIDLYSTGKILSPVFGFIKKKFYLEFEYAQKTLELYPDLPLEIL